MTENKNNFYTDDPMDSYYGRDFDSVGLDLENVDDHALKICEEAEQRLVLNKKKKIIKECNEVTKIKRKLKNEFNNS